MIVVLDDGTRIEGCVTVARRGARLSDFLAQSDREFITVSQVCIRHPSGETEEVPFTMIARRFVKLISPKGTAADSPNGA